MNILITGGTGFIGSKLRDMLLQDGHYVTIITRSPEKYQNESAKNQRFISWDDDLVLVMEEMDAVINLAGSPIFGQRWTEATRQTIYDSRIENTRKIVQAIKQANQPPKRMISASAVGYYGDKKDKQVDENAAPGEGFLSTLCVDWEAAAEEVSEAGVRLAIPRIGIVLGTEGGALPKMLTPFKLFVGASIGSGEQYFPWVHIRDLCRGLVYPLQDDSFEGVYNLASPGPVSMDEFTAALGEVLHRPVFFRVPEFLLNLVLGEAANPITDSLRVQPKKLQQNGFEFQFPNLKEALADVV